MHVLIWKKTWVEIVLRLDKKNMRAMAGYDVYSNAKPAEASANASVN